jgi:hypothetical protein
MKKCPCLRRSMNWWSGSSGLPVAPFPKICRARSRRIVLRQVAAPLLKVCCASSAETSLKSLNMYPRASRSSAMHGRSSAAANARRCSKHRAFKADCAILWRTRAACACAVCKVMRSLAADPPVGDLCPRRRRPRPLHACRQGRCVGRFARSSGRGSASPCVIGHMTSCRRHSSSGARTRLQKNEDRPALGPTCVMAVYAPILFRRRSGSSSRPTVAKNIRRTPLKTFHRTLHADAYGGLTSAL